MKYTVFVTSPVKIEINSANEEEAKKKVFDNLVSSGQIKSTDYVEIKVVTEIKDKSEK